MNSYTEKRVWERHCHSAPIAFSYFNKKHCHEAQTLDHCDGGMRFKSAVFLPHGATVSIRVTKFDPDGCSDGDCRGLRSVTLAEVKWCRKSPTETERFYETGVKYYQPEY